eukprot:364955-Chlamydomonas_euryale.AAC.34
MASQDCQSWSFSADSSQRCDGACPTFKGGQRSTGLWTVGLLHLRSPVGTAPTVAAASDPGGPLADVWAS